MNRGNHSQRGTTLLVSLIMLVLITLLAVTSFHLGKSSLQIVGNMQNRNESMAAAQEVIEQAISTTRMFEAPTAVLKSGSSYSNTKSIDMNGDGTADINVTLATPTCIKEQIIQNDGLDVSNSEDAGCITGTGQSFGVEGSGTGDSLCADTTWQVEATAKDVITEAQYTVTEGVAVRVSRDVVATFCP